MAKNIVFCADGTWNGPGEEDSDDQNSPATNAFKTFVNLDGIESPDTPQLAKEQEKALSDSSGAVRQVAKYLHGVGDSSNILNKLLGGSLGAGLITRIVRGYTFVSRNYSRDDQIFLLGFSRGAYTARALGGLIAAKGLLDQSKLPPGDKEAAYRAGAAVWYDYRRTALKNDPDKLGKLEQAILDLPAILSRAPSISLVAGVAIRCIAVWDTVGSLGIPEYNSQKLRIDAFQFCDTNLSPSVARGLHAISVDDRRADFTPTLWTTDPVRILQALFPGAHGDVGGGYATAGSQSGLSDGALAWMTCELAKLNVLYAATPGFPFAPDAGGIGHQPWISPPWDVLPQLPQGRFLTGGGLALHRSVLARLGAGTVLPDPSLPACPYAPINLRAYIANGQPINGVQIV
jgi:uncharacterized protein (DUF2235 family)